uniref:GHMP kinase n=1 Tax=Ignisphaera aggregans TaxID=334771 RepID=A0A7C4NMZ6_9CREN
MLGQVEIVKKEFENMFKSLPDVVVSAPGRLDFLNTHQDYKGLPVVAVGINLRTYIAIKQNINGKVVVGSGNIKDEAAEYVDEFLIENLELVKKPKWFGNYVRAALLALKMKGLKVEGAQVWIRSWVPIGSGLGSSGTLLVSVIAAFNEAFNLGLTTKDVAELAYVAEHDVMGIPCGRLDQYAAAFGHIVYIETKPPYNVDVLPPMQGFFAAVDTGIRHSTAEIHPTRQREIEEGLSKLISIVPDSINSFLGQRYWEPKWELLDISLLEPYLGFVGEKSRKRIVFTLKTHRSTMLALKVIKGVLPSADELAEVLEIKLEEAKKIIDQGTLGIVGAVMIYQHKLLSGLYDVSLPQIDLLVEKLVEFGALGAKLSGAGLGGAVIALFKDRSTAENTVRKVLELGLGIRGWVLEIDKGVLRHW